MIRCYFDGCCEPINPGGNVGYGALIYREESLMKMTLLWQHSATWEPKTPGATSNNIAEYLGVMAVLAHLPEYWTDRAEPCIIHGDSKLVIMQLSGEWQINRGLYRCFAARATELLADLGKPAPRFEWIPREKNSEADALSKGHLERAVPSQTRGFSDSKTNL
jgi:ribonuclease HI